MNVADFGKRLKELREAARLTQQGLAEKAGLTRVGIAQLESGRREPAWSSVLAICAALGVELDAFSDPHQDESSPSQTTLAHAQLLGTQRLPVPQPDNVPPGSILLGWEAFGESGDATADRPSVGQQKPILYSGDGHLITFAPTGYGKGRGVLVPNLLLYPGPVIVFDPKGELYHVTARHRREMGQRVVKLDPWQVLGPDSDSLNPFDIFALDNANLEADADSLAEWLTPANPLNKDSFRDLNRLALHSALIAHVASALPVQQRNLDSVFNLLLDGDVAYNLAVLLDTQGKTMNRKARDGIASFLQNDEKTRAAILVTASESIRPLCGSRIAGVCANSTFDLKDVVSGAPVSIYMVCPPDRVKSHKALLQIWVGTLLKALTNRPWVPPLRTLMLLDECAQLANFPYLEAVITIYVGYGVQCWTFWQDMSQLQACYPSSWATILNNCAVLQTFGIPNRLMATKWSNCLEHSPEKLLALPPERQVVRMPGRGEFSCWRPDYLTDELFGGLFDENPFYALLASKKSIQAST